MKFSPPFACLLLDSSGIALDELVGVAFSYTPEVARSEREGVFLGLGGVLWRWGTEEAAGRSLLENLEKRGVVCRLGVARRAFVARLAAQQGERLRVIVSGKEEEFLENLPLYHLQPSDVLANKFSVLGLRRVGDLLRLSPSQVGLRLGKEGIRLWRLCRGQEDEWLWPLRQPENLCEELQLEEPLECLEQIQAALTVLFENLVSRKVLSGYWLEALELELFGGQQRACKKITLRRPAWKIKRRELSDLLEGLEFSAPAERLVLRAQTCSPRPSQEELFDARSTYLPPPQKLLARGQLWQVQPVESYLPGEFRLVPYREGASVGPTCSALLSGLWRALRPPAPVRVECQAGRPVKIEASGRNCPSGRVGEVCGPWRLESRWWSPDAFCRDYYQVELGGGRLCRLYFDRLLNLWFVDGLAG